MGLSLVSASIEAQSLSYRLSQGSVVAAHGADLATTEFCLGAKTCRELNPWLGHFSNRPAVFGATKMGTAALGLWATAKIHGTHPKLAQVLNWTVSGAYAVIAARNTRIGQ